MSLPPYLFRNWNALCSFMGSDSTKSTENYWCHPENVSWLLLHNMIFVCHYNCFLTIDIHQTLFGRNWEYTWVCICVSKQKHRNIKIHVQKNWNTRFFIWNVLVPIRKIFLVVKPDLLLSENKPVQTKIS